MHEALIKGLVAAGYQFKTPGPGSCVIISVKDSDKKEAAELAWKLHDYGYKIYGTPGTARYLNSQMVPCSTVRQMSGERPNVLDLLESGLVDYIISTSPHGRDPHRDSVKFRRKATELSIPCITALDTARILVNALRSDHDISGMEPGSRCAAGSFAALFLCRTANVLRRCPCAMHAFPKETRDCCIFL